MTFRSLKLIVAAIHAALLLAAAPAMAQDAQTYRAGSLIIETPWSRATPGGAKIGAGYMRIVNHGTEPDRLVGGSMAAAGGFALHETTNVDGVARMRPVGGGLVIAPGATVDLSPGGVHVMLVDLKRPLMQGDIVKGTLVFEKAGTVSIAYRVSGIGAQSAGSSSHHHH